MTAPRLAPGTWPPANRIIRPAAPVPSPRAGWLALVIVAAGVWAYANSLAGVFVLDDLGAIVRNQTIRGDQSLAAALAPPTASAVTGRPLANLSFALNYAVAPVEARDVFEPSRDGRDPSRTRRFLANAWGYHAVNLAVHLCAALVLFGVVRRTLVTGALGPTIGSAAGWLALSVAAIWVVHPLTTAAVTYVEQRVESLMALFYMLMLAPSSSVLPIVTDVAAEHRMYLPLAAVVAAVVVGAYRVLTMVPEPGRLRTAVGAAVCLAVVLWLGAGTRARNVDYTSETRLWRTAVEARPSDARSRMAYGTSLAADGQVVPAEAELEVAVRLAPADPVARVRLGPVLARQNKLDAAVAQFQEALVLRPDDVDAHRFMADAFAVRREDARAAPHYERALRQLPGDPEVSLRLAAVLADSRDQAVRDAPRAVNLVEEVMRVTGRRDMRALDVLSVALAGAFRWSEAAATAREAASSARERGDGRRAAAFDYRAGAYEQAARQGLGPRL